MESDAASDVPNMHAERFVQWNVEVTMTHFAVFYMFNFVLRYLEGLILSFQREKTR